MSILLSKPVIIHVQLILVGQYDSLELLYKSPVQIHFQIHSIIFIMGARDPCPDFGSGPRFFCGSGQAQRPRIWIGLDVNRAPIIFILMWIRLVTNLVVFTQFWQKKHERVEIMNATQHTTTHSNCFMITRGGVVGQKKLGAGSCNFLHSFTDKKSKTPKINFPGPFRSPRMLKYKEKTAFTYNIQRIVYCRKFSMKQNVDVSCSEFRWTIVVCSPFEPLEKCLTFKDTFPGLSTALSFQCPEFCIYQRNFFSGKLKFAGQLSPPATMPLITKSAQRCQTSTKHNGVSIMPYLIMMNPVRFRIDWKMSIATEN